MTKKIALIGYGAISTKILNATANDADPRIAQLLVRPARVTEIQQKVPDKVDVISQVADLADDIHYVVECAGHDAVRAYAAKILERGIDFGIISVGALADPALFQQLETACQEGKARLCILSGAIGGIDALSAARGGLNKVSYSARKPPMSWSGSPAENSHNLSAITEPTVLFSGSAREAALQYPKNANVVATVALAGIGFERTDVTLWADPAATGNSHEICATGAEFDLRYQTTGAALAANPKTSALTALSAIRSLKSRAPGIVI